MNFNILKATTTVSKWEDRDGELSLNFQIAPEGRAYLDIGDDYILCSRGYWPFRDQKRQPVQAEVTVTTNPEHLSHIGGEDKICGYAQFLPARKRGRAFEDDDAATLVMQLVIEPHVFDEMLRLQISEAGAATIYMSIDGLDFGWEPDGSHQVWDLNDKTDNGKGNRRRITDFSYRVATFQTTEGEIARVEDRRSRTFLAESPDPEDRKLAAADPPPEKADPVRDLLKQCRMLLIAILGVGILVLVRLSRG
jgi:hypothetical protein